MHTGFRLIACILAIGFPSAFVSAGGPNLLINGNFESGSLGWTNWKAPWASEAACVRNFFDQTPGHSGNYCLKLSTNAASFGVYQVVTVTPGRYYRIECLWKATFSSASNTWAEIEVLPGPYVYEEVDLRPQDLVHKMYSFDNPENPPVTFDWLLTPTLNGTAADINHYNGIRYSGTSDKMTVALKCGAIGGPNTQEWFDDIRLYEVRKTPSDFDFDGDVDLSDFGYLQSCFNGPNRPPTMSGCWDADFDGDADVDLTDFAYFQSCFNGPNRPMACPPAF